MKDVGREAVHQPAQKHLDYVRALREPLQKLAGLEASLLSELDASFPATWRDYRWISRRVVEPGPELNEWLRALRGYPADALEKAYQRKKDSHDLSWLVLMLMRATSRDPWLDEVLDAAATIGPESPAFWTASYYRARLLLDAGRIDAARQLLDTLPAEDALSLSDHNRFRGLRARAARSAGEFLFHGAMVPVQVGSTDGVRIFSYPGDGLEALRDGRSFFERDVIASINGYFQLLFFTLNREDFSFVIHLDRQPRTSRRREAQTGSRARSGSRSERTLDAVEHSRTLMEWWPFLIFHRGGLRIKVINNTSHGFWPRERGTRTFLSICGARSPSLLFPVPSFPVTARPRSTSRASLPSSLLSWKHLSPSFERRDRTANAILPELLPC